MNCLGSGCILLVAVTMLTGSAKAQTPVVPPGTGTVGDPYRISEIGHLVWMGANAGSSSGMYYMLQNDIDASATAGWNSGAGFSPIGTSGTPFMGVFDGNGKVIGGLNVFRPNEGQVGLFGWTDGVVKNVCLTWCSVTGSDTVGCVGGWNFGIVSGCYATGAVTGMASSVGGLVGRNFGTVSECYATCSVTGMAFNVGGLVGDNRGTVSGCYATGQVRGTEFAVGGLVGGNSSGGTVSGCHATGPVTGDSAVGGLVGYNAGGSVNQCYATGSAISTGEYSSAGGLVGDNDHGGTVSQSFATGSALGGVDVGGLVGYNGCTVTACYATGAATGTGDFCNVGGLVGWNTEGTVAGCYAAGYVTGMTANSSTGGLVGDESGIGPSIVSDSYWDTQTSGQDTSAGGTGKTTAEMKQQATFVGWDFTSIWRITQNVTYPLLRESWDTGYQDLGGGWRRLSWFGDYIPMGSAGWIWHNKHGFFYVPPSSTPQSIFFYAQDMGWLWTSSTTYPYLYRFSDGAWLWYNGATGPRWFLNMNTSHWESW